MASQIDFVIATAIFLIFLSVMINFLFDFLTNYYSITTLTELRVSASNAYNALFNSKGLPTDWWNRTNVLVKIGLINDIYRRPIRVQETSGGTQSNITVNATVLLDETCDSKAYNSTIRLFDFNGTEVNMAVYNHTYCSGAYVKQANIVFNLTLRASETQFFSLYYSHETSITPSNATLGFVSSAANAVATVFPEEKFQTVSIDRLKTLRNLTYDQFIQTLAENRNFNLEITEK